MRTRMSSTAWKTWKKSFDAWEGATARMMETWLESPRLLEPAGALLTAAMRAKAMHDEVAAAWWRGLGLPTRRDQERALHALNELHSRLYDLEERILDRER